MLLTDALLVSSPCDARGASPEVGYNVLHEADGVRILSGNERGRLVETPYDGRVFADEPCACLYIWRRIRTVAAPDSLSDDEREINRLDALEILRHVAPRPDEEGRGR